VTLGVSNLRVGALVVLVGQAVCLAACPGYVEHPAAPLNPPELDIPRLDAGAGAASAADGIRFGHPLPVVGGRWSVAVHASSRSGEAGGGEQVSSYDSEYTVEILAVDGPAPSRVKLRFAINAHSYQGNPVSTALEGNEYVVDARAPHVRDATDGAAPPDEAQRVLDMFPDLGTRTRIDEVLPDDAMHLGDRRDELAGAVLRVIHPRAWTLRSGTATLVSAASDHGTFEVTLDAASDTGLEMQLKGTAQVALRDARLTDLALQGPYSIPANTRGPQVTPLNKNAPSEPPGTFSLHRTITSGSAPRSGY